MRLVHLFILSCSLTVALGSFASAIGDVAVEEEGRVREFVPVVEQERLLITLLIRQMVLDRYDSTGTGILSEQDKIRLVKDAQHTRKEARRVFLMQFDKDGDGKLSPDEYKVLREYLEKHREARRANRKPGKKECLPPPPYRREEMEMPRPPAPGEEVAPPMVEIRTMGHKYFRVAPGLFLLTRNMLLQKYDSNGNGCIDPIEHEAVMSDAKALYQAKMKELIELYDLDMDGELNPMEREQALAESHQDNPLYAMDEPDDIDLFIRANISEVLLRTPPTMEEEDKN